MKRIKNVIIPRRDKACLSLHTARIIICIGEVLIARRKKGRPINGILILDKPTGMTSNSALQYAKRLYQAQKAGHTGSLDPLATGVLPLCFGEATKVSHYLLDSDKTYIARCILGAVTTTGDSDGEIIATEPVPALNKEQLLTLLTSFTGDQQQTPPIYSALKHNGRPLYEYARKGITIERNSRSVTIFDIKLLNFSFASDNNTQECFIEIEVHCSKGTYIRTLCEDIGQKIGCGAYISALRRTQSGPFSLAQAVTPEQINILNENENNIDELLLPADSAIQNIHAVKLNEKQYDAVCHGHSISSDLISQTEPNSHYRLYYNDKLLALAVLNSEGLLQPKRLLFL